MVICSYTVAHCQMAKDIMIKQDTTEGLQKTSSLGWRWGWRGIVMSIIDPVKEVSN